MNKTVVLSANATWNILNFRAGLIRRLQEAGWGVVAVAPADGAAERLAELGVRHVPIAMDNMGSSPRRDLRLAFDYWRILRRERPAAFLGWTIKPNVYGSLAAHALGIPVVNNVSGLGTAFIRRTLLTSVVSALYRLAFRRSSTVFFQNAEDRALFVADRLVRPEKAQLLPGSGIDLGRFVPGEGERRPDAPFVFLLVARLLRDKGVVEYVDAARLVRAIHTDVRFRLLGFLDVANRSAVTREEVEAWVEEGVIDYLGQADDVRPIMAEADCVVLPSYREGMPRTLLEASALAKPLIATDVPGCREIARAGENAFLAQVGDARSLADAMLALLALPPTEREGMGARGRLIAEREFDERIVGDRYLAALERALAERLA